MSEGLLTGSKITEKPTPAHAIHENFILGACLTMWWHLARAENVLSTIWLVSLLLQQLLSTSLKLGRGLCEYCIFQIFPDRFHPETPPPSLLEKMFNSEKLLSNNGICSQIYIQYISFTPQCELTCFSSFILLQLNIKMRQLILLFSSQLWRLNGLRIKG